MFISIYDATIIIKQIVDIYLGHISDTNHTIAEINISIANIQERVLSIGLIFIGGKVSGKLFVWSEYYIYEYFVVYK